MLANYRVYSLLLILVVFYSSCGNKKDQKDPIGDSLSGVKAMIKVPESPSKFFLLNVNNYNLYKTGSVQVYDASSKKTLEKALTSIEVPSFGASILVVKNKYVFVAFESEDIKTSSKLIAYEYNRDDKDQVTFTGKEFSFVLKRSSLFKPEIDKVLKSIVPINTLIADNLLAISCRGGELLIMDLSEEDPKNWKDPVHVRSYGDLVPRRAMIATEDNFLLLFSEVSFARDKKEKINKQGIPLSQVDRLNSLKEKTSAYQLVVYDLKEDLKYRDLKEVYFDENFWLSFNLKGQKADSTKDERFFRTNFWLVKESPKKGIFYISQKSFVKDERTRNHILELKIKEFAGLRENKIANQLKEEEKDKSKYDLLGRLNFSEKLAFMVEDEDSSTKKDAKEYSIYDFELIEEEGDDKVSDFCVISYNYSSKYYFMLTGRGNKVNRPYEKRKTKEAYWELLLWGRKFVTIRNSYKQEAKLILGELAS